MNDREYFQATSLSYELQAARRELAGFRSGEAYQKLRADYERVIREKDLAIKRLQDAATMYFARESKGHAGIKGTPVEAFGGILIHDHEACFYSYGSDHQECICLRER